MKSRYPILFFILTCLYLNGLGQSRMIDSLKHVLNTQKEDTNKVNTLNQLSNKLERIGNYDSAIIFANNAQALAEKLTFKKGIAKANNIIGNVHSVQGDFTKALECYFKSLKISEEIGDKSNAAKTTSNIGLVYEGQGDYPKALGYYFKSLKIKEEIGDKQGESVTTGNIGSNYFYQHDYDQALKYDFKALIISEELGDKNGIAETTGNIGAVYAQKHDSSKALEYYFKALRMNKDLGDKRAVAVFTSNIGIVYQDEHNYPKALEYYFTALKTSEEIGDRNVTAMNLCSIGGIYIIQKNYRHAKLELDSSLVLSKNIGYVLMIKDLYLNLTALDSATGNYNQAFEDYKKYVLYKDSLINDANTKKTVKDQMSFDFEQKQLAEKAEQDKKDAQQKIITSSIVAGLLLVLIFSGFIFRSLRITRKQKDLIGKQKAEVEQQKELVEEKNKDILDSITYAKRLQDAILPPLSLIKKYLPESFVLYLPKDIVAGDFYWMERAGDNILIAAADCTGHGVPGALVSVVCSNALNRTVKEFHITEPGKILDKVRELVLETFEKSESNVQDGMDISLCCINTNTKEIQWSGAYNSLWYIHLGEMKELPADKQPIGKLDKPLPFNTHNLNLQKGDTLYLFTDGYADQFGGPKGKKFKYKQMEELLFANSHKPMDEQKNILENTLEDWKGSLEQVDDVLIIGVRI